MPAVAEAVITKAPLVREELVEEEMAVPTPDLHEMELTDRQTLVAVAEVLPTDLAVTADPGS